ncbi:RraA family protein [Halomicrobium salinisoli]|uniref:RraA family protein n=1 Tax=Halomicrobium salinisoli TaxID=2878391 RepID=UPI001CF0C311|nr:RraA family protein [Halomicrobium salinisoli]
MSQEPEPVDGTVLDHLQNCTAPAIADTKHEGVQVVSGDIEPVHTDCAFAGTARTVTLDPSSLWAPAQTLDTAREDEIVVVDADDRVDEAVWGELLSEYAVEAGVRGLVTNGAVRDVAGMRDADFPAFARTVTPRGPSGREEVDRNVPVSIGGASIDPGDVLVGDETGVVVIDRDALDEVTSAAEDVAEKEREVERLIDEGATLEQALRDGGIM